MGKEEVITAIKLVALFVFYVMTLRKFKFSKTATFFDIVVALGSCLLLVGISKQECFLLSKYIILAAFMFYLLRGLMERLSVKLGMAILSLMQILYLSIPFLNLAYYFQSGQGIGLDAINLQLKFWLWL
jgi:hypothetical protein